MKWEALNPGQLANDGIQSLTAGLNYYIHSDNVKLMARLRAHLVGFPRGESAVSATIEFDEVLLRLQVIF